MVLAFGGVFLLAWLVLGWWIAAAVRSQATAHLQDRVRQLARLTATTVSGRSILNLTPESAQASLNGLQRTFSLWDEPPGATGAATDTVDDLEILLVMTVELPRPADRDPGAATPVERQIFGTVEAAERAVLAQALQAEINRAPTANGGAETQPQPEAAGLGAEAWSTEPRFPDLAVTVGGRAYRASITSWLEPLPQKFESRPPISRVHPVETIEAWQAASNGLYFDMKLHGNLPPEMQPRTRRNDLVVLYPVSAVERAQAQALRPILPVGLIALITVLAISLWLAWRLSGSLAALAANADQVAQGNLDTPIGAAAPTAEVARLQAAFVKMLEGLKESRGKLAQAERLAAIGTLATAVAHDIRTPLTAIKMTVEMQLDRIQKAGGDLKPFQVIQTELERLRILADSLIDFARNPPPAIGPVELRTLVGQCTDLLAPQFKHHRVQCEVSIEPADLQVQVDQRRFRQVLLNLLTNSMEATEREGRIQIVGAPAGNGSSGHWRLTITDNGAGIQPDILPRIFEPLVSNKAAGGGLGLTICKQIVEAHRGTIRAESPVEGGRGTRIWIEV